MDYKFEQEPVVGFTGKTGRCILEDAALGISPSN